MKADQVFALRMDALGQTMYDIGTITTSVLNLLRSLPRDVIGSTALPPVRYMRGDKAYPYVDMDGHRYHANELPEAMLRCALYSAIAAGRTLHGSIAAGIDAVSARIGDERQWLHSDCYPQGAEIYG